MWQTIVTYSPVGIRCGRWRGTLTVDTIGNRMTIDHHTKEISDLPCFMNCMFTSCHVLIYSITVPLLSVTTLYQLMITLNNLSIRCSKWSSSWYWTVTQNPCYFLFCFLRLWANYDEMWDLIITGERKHARKRGQGLKRFSIWFQTVLNRLNEFNNPCRFRRTEVPGPFGPGPRSRAGKTQRTEIRRIS